ncbi:hypothetical protein [Rubrivirga sp.]|uniref:hypothetical protein n=1 Tax=Rubrivirga sp. TaxID=1885344 RepID=UPI003C74D7AA
MKGSDLFAHVCNAALIAGLLFLVATDGMPVDNYVLIVLLTVLAPVASSVALWQRSVAAGERIELPSLRDLQRRADRDEMDPHTVLDLDARLEALELGQADLEDAARWRALVASGQVTGPAADLEIEPPSGGQSSNGRLAG